MTTPIASETPSPSDYVTQHLQDFAASRHAVQFSGVRTGLFVWNLHALVVAAILFVVLIGIAAFTDRWPPFRIDPNLGFGRRLYVWWSCIWRQWIGNMVLLFVGLAILHFVVRMSAASLSQFSTDFSAPNAMGDSLSWWLATETLRVLAGIVIYVLITLPVTGYMVRSGLAAHRLTGPARYGLWRATALGFTTAVWYLPGSLAIAGVDASLPHDVIAVLRIIVLIIWSTYIVLPRQIRRLERQAIRS